ncbi:cadherin-6-like isoform X2 [Stegostoma tigrinum]|uniref:cadherin-6-like isoform X2 n=1 Tax=Stegostoma tigrinum TaxID=3053191 RepID=UPI00286FF196|nr:cadherin-6-like isoform X2 [Stegostoma tigrinum]
MAISNCCALMLLWICLLELSLMSPLSNRTAFEEEDGVPVTPEDDKLSVLHRSKRGWMWNQFFLLEEYTGAEPQYVGKLHSDVDKGDGTLKYILSGDGAGTVFTIDENTGDIHALKKMDREEKSFYTLRAQAIERRTGRPVEPESEFIIKIHDINDNEPKFSKELYMATVPEMSDVGIIRTALPNMDREAKEQYQVIIQAKDMGGQMGGLSGTTSVNITLTDVNDNPPRFPQSVYQMTVKESSQEGTTVGRIKAYDADIGENAEITYQIIDGDGMNMFDITTDKATQEGIVLVKKMLDYESKKSYTLKVEAMNSRLDPRFLYLGPYKDTATVRIAVEDVDEPPVFSRPFYLLDVYEDIDVGTIIGTITAQDPDASHSLISYSIDRHTDLDRYFNINSANGSIVTLKPLDREEMQWHNITVIATETVLENSRQTSRVPVLIKVLDVNDNAPEFPMVYETFVCENAKAGQLIQTVGAVDKDSPPSGSRFFFSLAPESANNPNFTVLDNEDNTAGILTRRGGFRRQDMSTYLLPVLIADKEYPIQSSTNTLLIRVCACDSDGTMQSCNTEAIILPPGLSTGALIAILLCIIILLVIVVLFAAMRKQRKKEPLIISKEDIRDNIVSYNDEGGGEEDTQAFDISTLRNPEVIEDTQLRRDIKPENFLLPRPAPTIPDNTDVRDFINQRLKENDTDPGAPPYDSLATYAYEGNGSIAESLSSLESVTTETDQDYDYLSDWGPRFKKLSDMYGGEDSDRDS